MAEQKITPEQALQIIAQALREIPLPVESKNPQQLTHSVLSQCIAVLVEAIKPKESVPE